MTDYREHDLTPGERRFVGLVSAAGALLVGVIVAVILLL